MVVIRAAELEVLFTANTAQVAKAESDVKAAGRRIEGKPLEVEVGAETKPALDGLEKVEAAGKRIVSAKTMATVDANIEKAETSLARVQDRLDYLHSVESTMEVTADIKRAEAQLRTIERRRDALVGARETLTVDADVSPAEGALDDLARAAEDAGAEAGEGAGQQFGDRLTNAVSSIPIAGAVVGLGVLAAGALIKGFNDGLQVEARTDRLQALTGVSEADAARFGRVAAEVYSQNFGDSIESNMDTVRIALQGGLLDPAATSRDATRIVSSLAGIADVLEEDVKPVSAAVTTLLRTGVAKSADEAFDILAAGARNGLNANEDLVDTLTEYPSLFARLGLSGEDALGLINQGLKGGARNTDLVADALKEFQIRATDASETSATGFEAIGLNAEDMTAKIAAGGAGAREGLDQVLDGLNAMEDPVARNAAGVALFGTQWEDMGSAMGALDLSTAVASLDGVQGAAQAMFDTLADNDASKMETAQRNIQVAADGMKGALAAAFSEPLGNLADWVSQNRGPIMEFILGLANGALDFGEAAVEGAASAVEAFGEFASTALPPVIDGLATALLAFDRITPGSQGGAEFREWADGAIAGLADFDETATGAADTMRETFIPGIEDARARLNEFGEPIVNDAYLHDMMIRNANAVSAVGIAADGSTMSLGGLDAANLVASASGSTLERQIANAALALEDELAAAQRAGEGQDQLTSRYNSTRDALIAQVTQMGIAEDQAGALVDQILRTPASASTAYSSNSNEEKAKAQALADRITTLPDGSVVVTADTSSATSALDAWVTKNNGRRVTVYADGSFRTGGGMAGMASGGVLEFMASGGLTPMAPIAQVVPASTFRVVGDRPDVPESYIPLDGSARSHAILAETIRRMPGWRGMAEGGVVAPRSSGSDLRAAFDGLVLTLMVDGQPVRAIARAEARGVVRAGGR